MTIQNLLALFGVIVIGIKQIGATFIWYSYRGVRGHDGHDLGAFMNLFFIGVIALLSIFERSYVQTLKLHLSSFQTNFLLSFY